MSDILQLTCPETIKTNKINLFNQNIYFQLKNTNEWTHNYSISFNIYFFYILRALLSTEIYEAVIQCSNASTFKNISQINQKNILLFVSVTICFY